jgi:hypothetical protein
MLTEGSGKLNSKCEYIHFYTGQIVFFFLCTKVERENLSDIYTGLRWVPRLHRVEVQRPTLKPSGPSYLLAFQLLDGE